MRLVTFNVLHARSPADDAVDLARFRSVIADLDADVLALQEVDVGQPRSRLADLTGVAAEAMGAVSQQFVAAIAGTPGATWLTATGREDPGAAAYGIALLSRYPASAWQVVRLPRVPLRFPMYVPGPNRVLMIDGEPRAAVLGRFDTPLGPLTVANTHLSFVPGWNRRQLRRVVRELRGLPGPHLLVGDLNMPPAAVRRWARMRELAVAPTFPADAPDRQLDHVLTDDPTLVATSFRAPRVAISDHRPLIVELRRARADTAEQWRGNGSETSDASTGCHE